MRVRTGAPPEQDLNIFNQKLSSTLFWRIGDKEKSLNEILSLRLRWFKLECSSLSIIFCLYLLVSLELQVRQKLVCRDKRSSLFTGSTIVLIKSFKTKLKLVIKIECFFPGKYFQILYALMKIVDRAKCSSLFCKNSNKVFKAPWHSVQKAYFLQSR